MMLIVHFPTWMQWAYLLVGAALVYSCLCRARHMTGPTTRAAIRYATTALAGCGFTLPFVAFLRPDWLPAMLLVLGGAALSVQAASAFYWRGGLPLPFTKRIPHAEHFMNEIRRIRDGGKS